MAQALQLPEDREHLTEQQKTGCVFFDDQGGRRSTGGLQTDTVILPEKSTYKITLTKLDDGDISILWFDAQINGQVITLDNAAVLHGIV